MGLNSCFGAKCGEPLSAAPIAAADAAAAEVIPEMGEATSGDIDAELVLEKADKLPTDRVLDGLEWGCM